MKFVAFVMEDGLLEQFGIGTGAYEDNQASRAAVIKLVRQQEVTPDVALTMPVLIATEQVIPPFRTERAIVGDQQKHGVLEPVQVVPARIATGAPNP